MQGINQMHDSVSQFAQGGGCRLRERGAHTLFKCEKDPDRFSMILIFFRGLFVNKFVKGLKRRKSQGAKSLKHGVLNIYSNIFSFEIILSPGGALQCLNIYVAVFVVLHLVCCLPNNFASFHASNLSFIVLLSSSGIYLHIFFFLYESDLASCNGNSAENVGFGFNARPKVFFTSITFFSPVLSLNESTQAEQRVQEY